MPKEETLEMEGVVTEILPGGRFRVQLETENEMMVLAYTAGKMRKNRIKTMVGDRVTVEMTPYDLSNARLIYRHKAEGSGGAPGARRPAYRPRR
jgi:translation initiation factor IF-1